jgi:hypothetical protein
MKSIIIVLGFLLAFNAMNCCKDVENCPRFFTLPVSITPVRDTYNIGDTIKIVSEFSNQLIGLNIEQKEIGTFDMHGIKWKPRIRIYKIDTLIPKRDDHISEITNYFYPILIDTSLVLENFSTRSQIILGEYKELNSIFSLNFLLIPKTKGIFYVEFDSGNNYGTFGFQDYPGVCDNEKLYVYYKTNEGQNTNLHYLKESPDPYWDRSRPNGYTGDIHTKDPEETGGYCFKVE